MADRTRWQLDGLDNIRDYVADDGRRRVDPGQPHNLISSLCDDGTHMSALDLDVPHTYRPSSTPGHGHLLIDVPLTPEQHTRLLRVLGECGILGDGFVTLSEERGASYLRAEGIRKPPPDPPMSREPY